MNLDGGQVIGMATSEEGENVLTVSEKGYGKLTKLSEFRLTHRGSKGVKAMNVTDKTGSLVCMRIVNGDEDLMIMTNDGIIIRISMDPLRSMSRNTQGVRLIRVEDDRKVSAVAVVEPEPEDETEPQPADETADQTAADDSDSTHVADNTETTDENN